MYFIRLHDAISTTGDVLEILAAIVSLYLMYRRHQDNGNGQADIQQEARDANVLNVDVPEQLGELRDLFQEVGALSLGFFIHPR